MKYDKSLHVLQRENYQTAEWESIIKGELDDNRPASSMVVKMIRTKAISLLSTDTIHPIIIM